MGDVTPVLRRVTIRWDAQMGCYRVNVPEWDGGEVVPIEVHEGEVERLRGLIGRATRKLDEGGVMGARELLAKELHG